MTLFLLQQVELSDPQSYDPDGTPGAGDTVRGTGVGGRNGTLNVERVENLWIANNASVTANSADNITVGNFNGAGGAVTFTINGTVTGSAVVWSNGSLDADTITGTIQGRGGTITLGQDLIVGGSTNSIDVSLEGGSLTTTGALSFTGAQSDVDVDGAVLTADTISFGGGQSTLSISDGGQVNVGNASTLSLDGGDAIGLNNGATLAAGGLDVSVAGASLTSSGQFFVDTQSMASIASLDVTGFGTARSLGSILNVAGDVNIGVSADGGRVEVFDISGPSGALKADNVTVGNGLGAVDSCGKWTYSGTSGALAVSSKGYASIQNTLTLDNADNSGINLFSTSSIHVGGDGGYVPGQFLVDGNGSVVGHGTISAPNLVVNGNGTIGATAGTLTIDSAVTGSGKMLVDDSAVLRLRDAASADVEFLGRADESLGHASILDLDDPANFGGSIGGLTNGITVQLNGNALAGWTGLNNPSLAHTEIQGNQLVLTFTDVVGGAPVSTTESFDIGGAPSNHTFTIRDLAGGDYALSFVDASNQIVTGVDGSPTNGANPNIDSLINGWGAWNPAAGPITYWFGTGNDLESEIALHGETDSLGCNDTLHSWSGKEKTAFREALDTISAATGLTFEKASSASDANLVWWQKSIGGGTLGISDFPSQVPSGHLWQIFDDGFWSNPDTLTFGGDGRQTIIHEIVHSLGLAHPHDGGFEPDLNVFPGVPYGDDSALGTNGQNQPIFTVMSYRYGWTGEPRPQNNYPEDYGGQGGLGAFDIAALQELYGTNPNHNDGKDTYKLPTANQAGTGWSSIWDTGGRDTISNAGSGLQATIDLREAPLAGANAGGYVSHADGIVGGFTIANGAVIEDATGGKANDSLIGNGAGNHLDGGKGNDTLLGNANNDTLIGGKDKDVLKGGSGDDTVIGGKHRDKMWGGTDEDIFDFNSVKDSATGSQRDQIKDFDRSDDLIDLSTIDAKKGSGNQKFQWIGKQDFHDKKGELRYEDKGSKVHVQGDVDGDGNADFEIFVKVGKLGASDFDL